MEPIEKIIEKKKAFFPTSFWQDKVWVAENLTKRSSVLLLHLVRFSTTQTLLQNKVYNLNKTLIVCYVKNLTSFFDIEK